MPARAMFTVVPSGPCSRVNRELGHHIRLLEGDLVVAGAREYAKGRGAIYETVVEATKGPNALTPQT